MGALSYSQFLTSLKTQVGASGLLPPTNFDQVGIILLLAGEKSAIELTLQPVGGLSCVKVDGLVDLLESMGIFTAVIYCRDKDNETAIFLLAKNAGDISEIKRVWADGKPPVSAELKRRHGELSGFPITAIDAFLAGRSLEAHEIPYDMRLSPDYAFGRFRYSKSGLRRELTTGKRWAKVILEADRALYDDFLGMSRRNVKREEAKPIADNYLQSQKLTK
jgi:hypothetical protein